MLDPEIEEEEEINQLADEEEAEEPEETLRERQIREAAERQAALLAGTGREMYELAGIDPERAAESDVAKLVIEQTQDVLDSRRTKDIRHAVFRSSKPRRVFGHVGVRIQRKSSRFWCPSRRDD